MLAGWGASLATKRIKNPESLDAVDIALARSVDSDEARMLLGMQARLIETQETLARADLRHRGWQIIGERVAALLKVMTIAVGLLLILAIALFFWSARQASGMVMDPFSVPPAMDRQGLTGAVVAQQLLDKIATLEASTQSARSSSSYENSWGDSKGVAVPYAGVSLGQLRREAREWLGSEKHLSGDVVRLDGGRVAISFRSGNLSGRVEGAESDFNSLMDEAAKLIFKETQPYRYSVWVARNGGELDEVRQVYDRLLRSPDQRERLWAMHGMALSLAATDAERVAIYGRALRLKPDFLPAIGNLPYYAANAGQNEKAYRLYVRSAAAYRRGQEDYSAVHSQGYALDSQAIAASYKGDLTTAAEAATEAIEFSAAASNAAGRPFVAAAAWARARNFRAAYARLAAAGYLDPARRSEIEAIIGKQESLRLLQAYATDDFAVQAAELLALIRAYEGEAAKATDRGRRYDLLVFANALRPQTAVALARSNRIEQARAVIAAAPPNHDDVLAARAFVIALGGDAGGGDRLFAQASARTPSLPGAPLLWAEAAYRTGRFEAAEAHAREALKRGPKSAEAAFWLGEALLAKGEARDAAVQLRNAARLAPDWGRLHVKLGSALWQAGDRAGASAALARARSLDLNRRDRATVERMIAIAATA